MQICTYGLLRIAVDIQEFWVIFWKKLCIAWGASPTGNRIHQEGFFVRNPKPKPWLATIAYWEGLHRNCSIVNPAKTMTSWCTCIEKNWRISSFGGSLFIIKDENSTCQSYSMDREDLHGRLKVDKESPFQKIFKSSVDSVRILGKIPAAMKMHWN